MEVLFIILQVIMIDGILSIDNAAALAALASKLPKDRKPPLPNWLGWMGHNQQDAALKVGILGAYLGRGLMLLVTGFIIQFPIIRLFGAAYLFYLVWGHFFSHEEENKPTSQVDQTSRFWKMVLTIELADLAFSVDNVVAVVALSSHIWVIILGVLLSIIIMRFAAGIFIKLIKWEPLLEHAAYVLIFAIAVELILKHWGVEIHELTQFMISVGIIFGFIVIGQIKRKEINGSTN